MIDGRATIMNRNSTVVVEGLLLCLSLSLWANYYDTQTHSLFLHCCSPIKKFYDVVVCVCYYIILYHIILYYVILLLLLLCVDAVRWLCVVSFTSRGIVFVLMVVERTTMTQLVIISKFTVYPSNRTLLVCLYV